MLRFYGTSVCSYCQVTLSLYGVTSSAQVSADSGDIERYAKRDSTRQPILSVQIFTNGGVTPDS